MFQTRLIKCCNPHDRQPFVSPFQTGELLWMVRHHHSNTCQDFPTYATTCFDRSFQSFATRGMVGSLTSMEGFCNWGGWCRLRKKPPFPSPKRGLLDVYPRDTHLNHKCAGTFRRSSFVPVDWNTRYSEMISGDIRSLETGSSISESRHEQFPFPSLDLSCGCFSLSCR